MKIKRYKRYSIANYKNYKKSQKCPFETYEPENKIEMKKEHAIPFFVKFCHIFLVLGGVISVCLSGVIVGVRGFFGVKKEVDKVVRKNEKVVEFRIKK
jgi:hypothetical protein